MNIISWKIKIYYEEEKIFQLKDRQQNYFIRCEDATQLHMQIMKGKRSHNEVHIIRETISRSLEDSDPGNKMRMKYETAGSKKENNNNRK